MDEKIILKRFRECGVPVRCREVEVPPGITFSVNVRKDKEGREEFDMAAGKEADVSVLDNDKGKRQLLLLVKREKEKERFLMGYDERHLFVSALNEAVSTVRQAHKALKPSNVEATEHRGEKVVRQGEWFFVPEPDFTPPYDAIAYRKEAIEPRRGWRGRFVGIIGNAHVADELLELFRVEGQGKEARRVKYSYVRGRIRHPEHATVHLKVWHRVYRNMEAQAAVGFVD